MVGAPFTTTTLLLVELDAAYRAAAASNGAPPYTLLENTSTIKEEIPVNLIYAIVDEISIVPKKSCKHQYKGFVVLGTV